jgi:hypothetical protein
MKCSKIRLLLPKNMQVLVLLFPKHGSVNSSNNKKIKTSLPDHPAAFLYEALSY